MTASTATLFRALWREEVRLHATRFGGGRFYAFPLVVLAMTAAGGLGLAYTGVAPGTIATGLRGLALAFGLYAGTAGLVGSDAMESLLGDVTLLLSTPATLPLSPRRLLGLFLAKDALFYAAVFLLPMALGAVPLFAAGSPTVAALVAAGLLWVETAALFALGMAITVAAIAARTRGVPGWAILAGAAGLLALAALTRVGAAVTAPTPTATAGTLLAAIGLGGAALVAYDPAYRPPGRTATARFASLAGRLPGDDDGLVAKTLLELSRSSGGVWKPVVSAGLLLAVVGGLLRIVETIVGVRPATGLFFGPVLALSAFTTYNWLTQFDALADYRPLPVTVPAVFRAKRRAFLLVGLPTGLLAYGVALAAFPTDPADAVGGVALFAGYALYLFGVTTYLGGFDPNEFLFDVTRFGLFGGAVALAVVPPLIASFLPAAGRATPSLAAVGGAAVALGAVGYAIAGRAGRKWEAASRAGGS